MKQLNKLKSLILGQPPIYELNDGKPVEEVVIRYKDMYFMIMLDAETGIPVDGHPFGWSHEPMTHTPIREFYTATRKKQ